MQKPSRVLADELARKYRSIESMRVRIEDLCNKKQLSNKSVTQFYEGLFLSAHVAFEGFIERLFIGLLVDGKGVKSLRHDVTPRITVRSMSIARSLLTPGNRSYVDWLPYDRTLDLAKKYFRGGRPFTDLDENEKFHLAKCNLIRNVIAHNSKDSREKFERKVLGSTPLLPSERSPSGYLRGLYRSSPVETRYESIVTTLLLIANKLSR